MNKQDREEIDQLRQRIFLLEGIILDNFHILSGVKLYSEELKAVLEMKDE